MLKRIAHIVLSVWLAILLVFGGTSMEFVHLLTDHQDTVHQHDESGLVIEPEHHHCDFLSFTLPAFLNDHSSVSIFFTPVRYAREKADAVVHLASRTVYTSLLRGPPASVFSF